MRMLIFLIWDSEDQLRSVFNKLERKDYRLRSIQSIIDDQYYLMCITKLGHFNEATMDAEILHILKITDGHGMRMLDEVCIRDPRFDDLSVN